MDKSALITLSGGRKMLDDFSRKQHLPHPPENYLR
jgi:hypothetical protein